MEAKKRANNIPAANWRVYQLSVKDLSRLKNFYYGEIHGIKENGSAWIFVSEKRANFIRKKLNIKIQATNESS